MIWGLSTKSGKATLARIPFLADLILDRQAGERGRAAISVFLIRRVRLVDAVDEVDDGGFLQRVVFPCIRVLLPFPILRTVAYVDAKPAARKVQLADCISVTRAALRMFSVPVRAHRMFEI